MRLVIILTALLAGCLAAGQAPRPAFPPAPSAGESGAEVEKWNNYVDLAHELEALLLPALNAYLETFGHSPEYQPPAQGSGLIDNYFLVLMDKPEDFSRVLDKAKAAAGREDELDRAVQELMPYLKDLWTDLGRSRELYLARRKADPEPQDGTEELRVRLDSPEELHARIFTAYQGFAATYERFRETLNRAGQERRQNDIQVLKRKGLVILPSLLETLDAGQGLQDYLNVRQISGAPQSSLKPEELRPFLVRLESASQILEAARVLGSDLEGLSEEALVEFCDQLRVVRAEAADLAGDGEAGGMRSSPEALARALGRLVDIYNLME